MTTTSTYDPLTLRLSTLRTSGPSGMLQDFSYQFDKVGNVTELTDRVYTGIPEFGIPGKRELLPFF